MTAPSVNGTSGVTDKSLFLNHLISYPVINDSINTVKSTPLGQRSIQLTNITLTKVQPLITPFSGPYNKILPYATPYLTKVDSLGHSALKTLDSKLPAVKKPTGELYEDGRGIAFFPLTKAVEGKKYVTQTYESELKKVGGEGLVTYGKAAITTGLIVSSDVLAWFAGIAAQKKAEAKEVAKEKANGV